MTARFIVYQLALERIGPMLLGPPESVEGHLR